MEPLSAYVHDLEELSIRAASGSLSADHLAVRAALGDQPSRVVRARIPRSERKGMGAFFTGPRLAREALRLVMGDISSDSVILDPSCGAGDLLLSCTAGLPTTSRLDTTLEAWGRGLMGFDLREEFIRIARARLILEAASRGLTHQSSGIKINQLFPNIRRRSGLSAPESIKKATHVVLNPPYVARRGLQGSGWSTGVVNSAALFVSSVIESARDGTRIAAILPDVLRSGSRYARWRAHVAERATVERVEIYGQFDQYADVDVFLLDLVAGRTGRAKPSVVWSMPSGCTTARVRDRFTVATGPVVDFRDPKVGPLRAYATPGSVPPWATVHRFTSRRRFKGRLEFPPFVAVRRTSRPGDKFRAVSALVTGKRPVAVDNHLLVLRPSDGTIRTCSALVSHLKTEAVNKWLDNYIRCRHLTVDSIAQIPWSGD
jgi:N-6 DNA Methylase